jgi:hypothetical protein
MQMSLLSFRGHLAGSCAFDLDLAVIAVEGYMLVLQQHMECRISMRVFTTHLPDSDSCLLLTDRDPQRQ